MPRIVELIDFLAHAENVPIIDARSEGEHMQGCLPGSINIALLNNEERAQVGTIYKQTGQEAAVLKGFELVGHKFAGYIKKAKELSPAKEVGVYCWRGGLRSSIMTMLLETAGFKVAILKGGYKNYRRYSLQLLEQPLQLIVLGGKTGSGKTELLKAIKEQGEQVIDLEGLANHKGSAFGGLGMPPQPSQEQFENLLAWDLRRLNISRHIWLEDESRFIGRMTVPNPVFDLMQKSPMVEVNVPYELRLERALQEYGAFPKHLLAENTLKVRKRMGGQHVKEALEKLEENNLTAWAAKLLDYYDHAYEMSMARTKDRPLQVIPLDITDLEKCAKLLVAAAGKLII